VGLGFQLLVNFFQIGFRCVLDKSELIVGILKRKNELGKLDLKRKGTRF